MTLISLIVLGYNCLPWNLAAELSLSSREGDVRCCLYIPQPQFPFKTEIPAALLPNPDQQLQEMASTFRGY